MSEMKFQKSTSNLRKAIDVYVVLRLKSYIIVLVFGNTKRLLVGKTMKRDHLIVILIIDKCSVKDILPHCAL